MALRPRRLLSLNLSFPMLRCNTRPRRDVLPCDQACPVIGLHFPSSVQLPMLRHSPLRSVPFLFLPASFVRCLPLPTRISRSTRIRRTGRPHLDIKAPRACQASNCQSLPFQLYHNLPESSPLPFAFVREIPARLTRQAGPSSDQPAPLDHANWYLTYRVQIKRSTIELLLWFGLLLLHSYENSSNTTHSLMFNHIGPLCAIVVARSMFKSRYLGSLPDTTPSRFYICLGTHLDLDLDAVPIRYAMSPDRERHIRRKNNDDHPFTMLAYTFQTPFNA